MSVDRPDEEISRAAFLERLAAEEGETYGPKLLLSPPSAWRRMMRSDPHFRSFGTLKYLLKVAREKFESQPSRSKEITSAVLAFVDRVEGPSRIHEIGLRGLAWKEHAIALQFAGGLRQALKAAERAIEVYGESPALQFDQTKASLVLCLIYRDMGEAEKALALARQCAEIFLDYADVAYRTMARMCEGTVLFTHKQFAEALTIFTHLIEQAELENDKLTLARALQNAAECAREIGDLEGARDLYPRARRHFEDLGLTTEATRVRWGFALCRAAEGKIRLAVFELNAVRGIFLSLGMNTTAATAELDSVRIRFEADEDVREQCAELVRIFTEAGMTQNAIEALAYLREQANRDNLTTKQIAHVRTYIDELSRHPTLLFARPPWNDEDEEG